MPETVKPGSNVWQWVSAVLGVATLASAIFAAVEYSTVGALREQLTAAIDDARQASAEETRLRGQLSDAQDRENAQGQKLAAAVQRASSEAQQLDAAQKQVQVEQQRQPDGATPAAAAVRQDLPVRLSFHRAMFGSGEVAVLQNLSDDDLEVTLEVRSPADGAHARKRVLIGARGMARVGAAQGWLFSAGQVVTLNSAKYRPLVQTVS